jgi:FixJ family two-component response regulator
VTGHGDIDERPGHQAGAWTLTKPVPGAVLLAAVAQALARDAEQRPRRTP